MPESEVVFASVMEGSEKVEERLKGPIYRKARFNSAASRTLASQSRCSTMGV